jgi:hypothetical protein
MSWARIIAGALLLWSNTAVAATLNWNANSESDLGGYRIYQCNVQPCTKSSGSLFATTGKVTSFNLGTPSITQYYFITAYDFDNNESGISNVVTYTPTGSTPVPSPAAKVNLTVVGNPATGPWGVEGSTSDLRDVMATIRLDGAVHHTEHNPPYGFPSDNGTGRFGNGSHKVEFVFYLQDTTTEIGRASVTVQEGIASPTPLPPPSPVGTVNLTVVGNPATGPWGIEGTTSDLRNVMATIRLDGAVHHTEHNPPYGFPSDNGITATTGRFGNGTHKVEFVFYLQDTTTEIGRASVTVQEGSSTPLPPPPMQTVTLTVVGNPATGPWGVAGSTTDQRDVMAMVLLDGDEHHIEHYWPYGFPDDNGITATTGKFGRGPHTVEFVFYLEGTSTEIGRASITVQEG